MRLRPRRQRFMSPITTRMLLPIAVAFGCATTSNIAHSAPQPGQGRSADSVNLTLSRRVAQMATPRDTTDRQPRLYAEPDFRVHRSIGMNEDSLFVGDTASLFLVQFECEYDVCTQSFDSLTDSGWTVSDRRHARLLPVDERSPRAHNALMIPPSRMIVALRPGHIVVRARGVHGMLDAALESDVASFDLDRTFVIRPKPPRRKRS